MGRMERQQAAAASASMASSAQLHALIGPGEFLLFSLSYLKFAHSLVFLSIERRFLSLSTLMESIWAGAGLLAAHPIWFQA
jgi:hypothetical protein